MRLLPLALTITFATMVPAAEPEKVIVDLFGGVDGRGLALAECRTAVYRFQLIAQVDANGEGKGTLVLDPSRSLVDEFGYPQSTETRPPVKLDCSLKLVKKKKILREEGRLGAPAIEVECRQFSITGPKITSRLTLATEAGEEWSFARLLVPDQDGKGRFVVYLRGPALAEPCHPGCFPAGTSILIPGGAKPIEDFRAGDLVTTVTEDGIRRQGQVVSMSVTRNRLIEVRTEGGTLITTATQPLALASGGLRAAGKLKAGDRIHAWDGQARRNVGVKSVDVTGREEQVFNLILGEPVLFVADGFLARSKPPVAATARAQP